ncbi:MAG: HAD-IIIA family hydrolase [Clostridiales bacterium]|uniref:HAD-IIIA family hydrolase n=1 Tax=Terrisporobacter sp. TaxID=1965305 RepID=UPI002A5131FE|nr:HAD-IIIA family hydrolase [Terrisporobacter sp.]MDD7755685.1 HAD-IIIA family hydrolase [Clostridiales bacterium]MDY4135194.1 HAD-IIIA family hydrolase [Terrisporobacter sp.]
MNEILKNKKVIFCDLDGTLIETISGESFPKGIWDMRIKLDVLDAIKKLNPEYVLIVSNQGGIENGFVDAQKFSIKLFYIVESINEYCGCECYAMYCDTNNKSDPHRKPNTKMLETLLEDYIGDDVEYIKQKSLMIGDASGKEGQFSDSDKKTAENFGIDYMDVDDFVKI